MKGLTITFIYFVSKQQIYNILYLKTKRLHINTYVLFQIIGKKLANNIYKI